MSPRTLARVPFGEGLDRQSGLMVVEPTKASDLRNVVLRNGRVMPRKGYTQRSAFQNLAAQAMSDIVAMEAMLSQGKLIIAGYRAADAKVYIGRTNSLGEQAVVVDNTDAASTYATMSAAVGRPRLKMAEVYTKMFIAHDWGPIGTRAKTRYYDPSQAAGSKLQNLQANLNGAGMADVYFRGVARHLAYLLGWGFGTASDQDRGDIVRVSRPAEPTKFDAADLFYAGAPDDPVLLCASVGNVAKVLKRTQTYEIFGYDRRSFGIRLADARFGIGGSRLAVEVSGRLYVWSAQGPRVFVGEGASHDLEPPLDIYGQEPTDLPALGLAEDAWALYDPVEQAVRFYWPNDGIGQTRIYKLDIQNPERPRWSYDTTPRVLLCGAVFAPVPVAAPPGHPRFDAATNITSSSARLNTTHLANDGDENWEAWIRVSPAGAWSRLVSTLVSGVGTTQFFDASGLAASTTYDVAYRHERNGLYNSGAENTSDPSSWPVADRGQFTTSAPPAQPSLDSANLTIVQSNPACSLTLQMNVAWTRTNANAPDYAIDIDYRVNQGGWNVLATDLNPASSPYLWDYGAGWQEGTGVTLEARVTLRRVSDSATIGQIVTNAVNIQSCNPQ